MKAISYLFAASLLAASFGTQAAITITIQEVGDDVIVNGSGFLSNYGEGSGDGAITVLTNDSLDPSGGTIQAGNTSTDTKTYLNQQPEPIVFGNGPMSSQPTTNTGDPFGISYPFPAVLGITLPAEYISGSPLQFSMTFAEATLESLGIHLGTYAWQWGDVENSPDDSRVVLNVISRAVVPQPITATPVPTLGTFGLMGLAGAIGAAGVAMNRRRKQS